MKKVIFVIGLVVLASCAAPVKEVAVAKDTVKVVAVDTTKVVKASTGVSGVTGVKADTTKK
jgi:hypothetical protein